MNTPRILATTIVLLASRSLLAVADSLDGGGADNNVGADENRVDNNDPASNLTTADLILGSPAATSNGVVFDTTFSARRITMENAPAGLFAYDFTGRTLSVGSGAATATIGASGNSSGTLNVGTRGTINSGTGLTTVNATGTIAIIDSGTFFANGSVTLNGGQLTRRHRNLRKSPPV